MTRMFNDEQIRISAAEIAKKYNVDHDELKEIMDIYPRIKPASRKKERNREVDAARGHLQKVLEDIDILSYPLEPEEKLELKRLLTKMLNHDPYPDLLSVLEAEDISHKSFNANLRRIYTGDNADCFIIDVYNELEGYDKDERTIRKWAEL